MHLSLSLVDFSLDNMNFKRGRYLSLVLISSNNNNITFITKDKENFDDFCSMDFFCLHFLLLEKAATSQTEKKREENVFAIV